LPIPTILAIHAAKSFAENHLKINSLVSILCINQMREFDGLSQVIKSIVQRVRKVRVPSQDEVNKSSSHPAKEKVKLKKCNQRKTNIYLLIKETVCKSLSLLQITFKAHPDHDLMRGPVKMIRYGLTLLMKVV